MLNTALCSVSILKSIYRQPKFDPDTLSLAVANTGQSLIKHVLTEADRLAVARISPLDDQGGYAVAMNYGTIFLSPFHYNLNLWFVSRFFDCSYRFSTIRRVSSSLLFELSLVCRHSSIVHLDHPPLSVPFYYHSNFRSSSVPSRFTSPTSSPIP